MYLLDTNVIIGLHQRHAESIALIQSKHVQLESCFYSVISHLEVLGFSGNTEHDMVELNKLLAPIKCIELTDSIKEKTIELRRQQKIKLPDAIILATSQVQQLELLTFDKKLANLR